MVATTGLAKPMQKRSPFDLGEFFQQIFSSFSSFVNPADNSGGRRDQFLGPQGGHHEGPTDQQIFNGLQAFHKLKADSRPQPQHRKFHY